MAFQAVFNHPRYIGGELHPKSNRPVSLDDSVKGNRFFLGCVKVGDIQVSDEAILAAARALKPLARPSQKALLAARAKGQLPVSAPEPMAAKAAK